ncbi:MAG: hypothetical protein HN509_13080 [Halobacteriovoraceae bacterium]|nr:hypothetical protein [Halobacteriovoraceae bacterium]MBT5095423.1 hypothetical protein [Halobacteriovoraceae bacterium]
MKIEKKIYTEDSTPEEIKLLRERVTKLKSGILYYQEAPTISLFQLDIMWGKVQELSLDLPKFDFIIDLTGIERPNAEIRDHIKKKLLAYKSRFDQIYIVYGKDRLLLFTVKFIMHYTGLENVNLKPTMEEVMLEIEAREKNGQG